MVSHTDTCPVQVYFPSISEIVPMETHISRITDIHFEKATLHTKQDIPIAEVYSFICLRFFENCVILSCQEISVGLTGK
jgi:hypothetical protein